MRKVSLTYHLDRIAGCIQLTPIDKVGDLFLGDIETTSIKHGAHLCFYCISLTQIILWVRVIHSRMSGIIIQIPMPDSFIKCFVESHRCHRSSDRAHFLYLVIKPSRAVESLVINKDKSDFIALSISQHAPLNIFTEIFHCILHCANQYIIERLIKTTSKSVESLTINADGNRCTTHQLSLRDAFIELFYTSPKFIMNRHFQSSPFLYIYYIIK